MLQVVVFKTLDFVSASLQLLEDNGLQPLLPTRPDRRAVPLAYVDGPRPSDGHDTVALKHLVERVLDAGERACYELGGWDQLV